MHLSELLLLTLFTVAPLAAGCFAVSLAPRHRYGAVVWLWIAALTFAAVGPIWAATSDYQSLAVKFGGSIIYPGLGICALIWGLRRIIIGRK